MRFVPRPSKWKYYLMLAVINTVGRMRLGWRYGVARVVANRVYAWMPGIRDNLRANVRQVLGPDATEADVDRVARQCMGNTGRYYADVVGMGRMDVREFYEHDLILEGFEYIEQAQAEGRGVVLASAHYANPEFAVQGLLAVGIKVLALVEPLEPPELGRLMRGLRTVHGHHYEAVSFGSIKKAITWLKEGGVVCILVDRDIQKRGVEIEFCGAKAKFPTGAVDLAMRTDAMLLPGWVRREGGFKVHAALGPPMELTRSGDNAVDLRDNTARLLAIFEKHLRVDPGQWSVLDRIWPDQNVTPTAPSAPREEQAVR